MKLEKQVASLELSKKLKELGVTPFESMYYWSPCKPDASKTGYELHIRANTRTVNRMWVTQLKHLATFTCAELGVMLPCHVLIGPPPKRLWPMEIFKEEIWRVSYRHHTDGVFTEVADTEADARAKMMIYLIEKGVVDVVEVNKRLQG